ncbi:MAG: hypothetical protein AAFQ57_10815, partial [Cyanobacteria bacterium J06626_14]
MLYWDCLLDEDGFGERMLSTPIEKLIIRQPSPDTAAIAQERKSMQSTLMHRLIDVHAFLKQSY